MNSRYENGTPFLSKEEAIKSIKQWEADGDIEGIYEIADDHISYYGESDDLMVDRTIYFPENETIDSLKRRLHFDDKVLEHINPDAMASFLYNHIDVNALACVEDVAFIWDDPDDTSSSKSRQYLYDKYSDEYAFEACDDNIGLCWVERSAVLINVGELFESSQEIAGDDFGYSSFSDIFRQGLISTIMHEFRHAIYELNETVELGGNNYPENGGQEEAVEYYGNDQADKILFDSVAMMDFRPVLSPVPVIDEPEEDFEREW